MIIEEIEISPLLKSISIIYYNIDTINQIDPKYNRKEIKIGSK